MAQHALIQDLRRKRRRLWTYSYQTPTYVWFTSNVYELQFNRYMRMSSECYNRLCELLAPHLHTSDNRFRPGIRGEEWIVLALGQLAGSKRFTMSSLDWQRGKSTMHKGLYRFCEVVNQVLRPHLMKFPVGVAAVQSA
jgi:hypothetical protein